MTFSNPGSITRQRGVTLIEFMVGLVVGMLVVLAAVASLVFTRDSVRTMTDSAGLEQQATLVMTQIGQQIKQANAFNGYLTGANPDMGTMTASAITAVTSSTGFISFDRRAFAAVPDNIMGQDGDATTSDTLVISYARPNDGSLAFNCIGQDGPNNPYLSDTGAALIVNQFSVSTDGNNNLICGDDITIPAAVGAPAPTGPSQPIAGNVRSMRIKYLSTAANTGNITYQTAAQVTTWSAINGLQVCLEMQGDPTGAVAQTYIDCQGNTVTSKDGRVHRIVQQTFSLRNVN